MNLGTEDKNRYPLNDTDETLGHRGSLHVSLTLLIYNYAGKCGLKLALISK